VLEEVKTKQEIQSRVFFQNERKEREKKRKDENETRKE
jgi:hypothetical protein